MRFRTCYQTISTEEEQNIISFYIQRLLSCTNVSITGKLLDLFCKCIPQGTDVILEAAQKLKLSVPSEYKIKRFHQGLEEQFLSECTDAERIEYISNRLERRPEDNKKMKELLSAALADGSAQKLPPRYAMAREIIKQLFSLSPQEIDLCEFLAANREFSNLNNYFCHELAIFSISGRRLLQEMLSVDERRLSAILEGLDEADIIYVSLSGEIELSEIFQQFWATPKLQELERQFLGVGPQQTHPLKEYSLPPQDIQHISRLITTFSVSDPAQPPVNILLYGPPGTGKSTFAASLAKELGLRLIVPAEHQKSTIRGREKRRGQLTASYTLAHSLALRGEKVVLLLDEAEKYLVTKSPMENIFSGVGEITNNEKSSRIHAFLERTQIPIIWICNKIKHIERALMRRFAYSLEFPEVDEASRVKQWRYLANNEGMGNMLNSSEIKSLAHDFDVPVGVMSQAIQTCRRICPDRRAAFVRALRRACGSFEKLCRKGGQAKKQAPLDATPTYYNPDAVCLKGGSQGVQTLLQRLQNADARLRKGSMVDAAACTLLFYGPPGTGKSALARYLSEQLGRKSMLVHASDILNCFVGNSEKNIASVFEAAESTGKVLIFDEVDTFLQNRQGASRSWEITRVNEFLTRLENFHGILIATTNNINQLDAASLRRFAAKVEFTWLSADSCVSLYKAMLGGLSEQGGKLKALSAEAEARLRAMADSEPGLTPGDFRTVRSMFMFEPPEDCTEERLLDALEAELNVKSEGRRRKISGFSA